MSGIDASISWAIENTSAIWPHNHKSSACVRSKGARSGALLGRSLARVSSSLSPRAWARQIEVRFSEPEERRSGADHRRRLRQDASAKLGERLQPIGKLGRRGRMREARGHFFEHRVVTSHLAKYQHRLRADEARLRHHLGVILMGQLLFGDATQVLLVLLLYPLQLIGGQRQERNRDPAQFGTLLGRTSLPIAV